ncbi:hypothetical protein FACS1894106_2490 [Spirochaetia bacterium]|nr:hypothetical protein FACS1894106_2490 [Spirochaetia bacterium]
MKQLKTIDDVINNWFDELEKDGTAGRWTVEKKLKEAKRLQRKTSRKLREEQAIQETLDELKAKKTA